MMQDMTEGSAHSHLWRYGLPLLLGNWLQLAYNVVYTMIAGRFIGKDALAAEGIAGPIMNLVILAITGLCIGSGILMSEYFGGRKFFLLRQSMATMLLAGVAVCSLISVLGFLCTPIILQSMTVPKDIFAITVIYLRITFLGMPFTFFYNALAAGLKSVGDSKTPLKFLAFSAILNAILDLIFLGIFKFGIVCSAVTTVIAEAFCAVLACRYMMMQKKEIWPDKEQWKIERSILARILRFGGPTAFQQAIQPIGKVLIQGQVNALGVSAIAAFNAVTRVDDFACIPEQSISSAISTFIAQNRGAGKKDRIRLGFFAGIRLELCYGIFIGIIVAFLRVAFVSLFVSGDGADVVIRLGSDYLMYMSAFYLWPALTNGFQGFFRGMGKMYTNIFGTVVQISIRTLCTYFLAPRIGIVGIAFACIIGWSVMLAFEIPYFIVTCKKGDPVLLSKGCTKQAC